MKPSRAVAHRSAADEAPIANGLLAALPRAEYQRLLASFEPLTLKFGEVLHEPGALIRHVYFPTDCVVSILARTDVDHALEVGLVGYEGMVGISLALGLDVSSDRALVQVSGTAMRMTAANFLKAFRRSVPLQRELHRYAYVKLATARQTAACNIFHAVEARVARWLLMIGDRVRSDEFSITQVSLADMLGVRRAAVSEAAGALAQCKLIRYVRGRISILDRKGLEAASCACYARIKTFSFRGHQ